MNSKSIEKPLPTKFSKFTAEFPEKTDFFYIVDGNLKICCYSVESYKIFKKKVDNIKGGQIQVFYTTREHLLSVASQQWESGLSSVASQQWENGHCHFRYRLRYPILGSKIPYFTTKIKRRRINK